MTTIGRTHTLYQGFDADRLAFIIRDLDQAHVAKTTILDKLELLNVEPLERRDTKGREFK